MAREQNSVQAERAGRSHIAPISLVKLTTYTDRTAATVDKVFYFADRAVEYDYGNTGTDQVFLPVVSGGSRFFSGFVHIPQPDDLTAFGKSFDLVCSNEKFNGRRLVTLLQDYNLEGASIEIAQMLLSGAQMDAYKIAKVVDLTALDGDEHTVLFRGRVNQVSPITDSILTIKCVTELPTMAGSWLYASDETKTDPRDLGMRLPRVYGNAKRVPCVNYEVGWETTFAEPLDASETGAGYEIADGSGLPAGSFNIRVDGEEITCSAAAATTLTIDTRGVGPTSGAAHAAGALAVELIATATYVVSDRQSSALDELYVINPLNGKLLRLNSTDTPWTTNLADTTTISGETITTVQFTAAQLQALMDYFEAQSAAAEPASVSQQPVFTTPTTDVIRVPLSIREGFLSGALEPDPIAGPAGSDVQVWSSYPQFQLLIDATDADVEGAFLWAPSGSTPEATRTVKRFRLIIPGDFAPNANTCHVRASYDFFGENDSSTYTLTGGADTIFGDTWVTGWTDVSGSPALSNIERSSAPSSSTDEDFLCLFLDAGAATIDSGGVVFDHSGICVECELDPVNSPNPTEVAVTGGGGGSAGFGLRFFADLSGITGGLQEGGESFDSGTWETQSCVTAFDPTEKQEGTNSLKITYEPSAEGSAEVIDTDSLTDWTGTGATLALEASEGHSEGSYAIEAIADAASPCSAEFYDSGLGLDLTIDGNNDGTYLLFDVKFKHNGSTAGIQFRFGTDSSNYWEHGTGSIDTVAWPEDTWRTFRIPQIAPTGSPDEADINYFAVFFNQADQGSPASGMEVYIDNIRTVEWPTIVQNNGLGGVNMESGAYHLWRRKDSEPVDGDLPSWFYTHVFITDSAGSGTTLPAAYRKIEFAGFNVADETWVDEEDDDIDDTGVPDLTDVNVMHIEWRHLIGPYDRDLVAIVHLDFFRRDSVSYGAHPAGIIVHHIEETGGETIDTDSHDALVTALGAAAEWGFDLRSLGFEWEEILARMAYEARCNVVSVETAAGRVWKLLSANNSYGFGIPAGSSIITQTHELSDVGRSVDDLASHFSFRYGFDASLPGGGSEEGFKLALTAKPSVSDVPITTALITAAAARFGAIESGPIAFRCIQDPATAQDVAGYLVQERMANQRRVFELGAVAWFDALPYDVGDLARIVPPWQDLADETQLFDLDTDAANWIPGAATLSDESGTVFEGAGSMKILIDNGASNAIAGSGADELGPVNVTDRAISFMCFIPTGDLELIEWIGMRISSTAGGATNYAQFVKPASAFVENAWQRIEIPIRLADAWSTNGSVDLKAIINQYLRFRLLANDDGTTFIIVDDVRLVNPSTTCRLTSMSKEFGSHVWDLTAVEIPEAGLRTP